MEFFTTSSGITVHVWDTVDEKSPTDAPTLVLLHGYLETMYVFNEFVSEMKKDYRIIVLDLPGHGLTDSAPLAEGAKESVNSVEFDVPLICGVMDKCGVSKAFLVGHSMGGYIAYECLKDSPERFLGVISISAHPFPDHEDMISSREREIKVIRAGKLTLLAEASIPKMYYDENLYDCDEKIRETVELCETHNPEGIIASIRGIASRGDLTDVFDNPSRPLMLIYGDHDDYLPVPKAEEMAEKYKRVKFVKVEGASHNSFIEKPTVVQDLIRSFTKENC